MRYTGGYDDFERIRREKLSPAIKVAHASDSRAQAYPGIYRPVPVQTYKGAPGPKQNQTAGKNGAHRLGH